ncbi:MAG: ABC transporter permease, partial [Bryobacteraceae bacterium]
KDHHSRRIIMASPNPHSRLASFRLHAGLLWEYFLQYLKVRVGYRGDFLISLGASTAATLFALAFVVVLFRRVNLPHWRFDEVVFLYGFSLIPYGLFNILSLNLYEFGNTYIMEGKFDRVLLRPVSSLFQVLFENFRIESFFETFTGIVIVGWMGARLNLHWTAEDFLLFALYGLCGGVIYVSVFLGLSTFSFWFEDRIGVHPPFWNLIAFGRYPLTIYSAPIQFFLRWIVPFGFATFYPGARLLHHAGYRHYAAIAPVMALLCAMVASLAWVRGVRHYSSTGS